MHPYWPLFDLEIRTPTLTLRYLDDDTGVELARLIEAGIHEPDFMPFATPWSTASSPGRERHAFRFWWRSRADVTPQRWSIQFAALADDRVIGAADLLAADFAVVRSVETGSWLGREFQGRGYGSELRRAMLHLAFAGLDALEATTGAWSDNGPSLGVTRRLGYESNGVLRGKQGDAVGALHKFRLTRERWEQARRQDIEVVGLERCLDLLGLA